MQDDFLAYPQSERQANYQKEHFTSSSDEIEKSLEALTINSGGQEKNPKESIKFQDIRGQIGINATSSSLSTDVFEYKENRKLPSKIDFKDFDFSEEL